MCSFVWMSIGRFENFLSLLNSISESGEWIEKENSFCADSSSDSLHSLTLWFCFSSALAVVKSVERFQSLTQYVRLPSINTAVWFISVTSGLAYGRQSLHWKIVNVFGSEVRASYISLWVDTLAKGYRFAIYRRRGDSSSSSSCNSVSCSISSLNERDKLALANRRSWEAKAESVMKCWFALPTALHFLSSLLNKSAPRCAPSLRARGSSGASAFDQMELGWAEDMQKRERKSSSRTSLSFPYLICAALGRRQTHAFLSFFLVIPPITLEFAAFEYAVWSFSRSSVSHLLRAVNY